MRDRATDDVSGRIRLGFAWDVSARSLLRLKLAVLERIYAQRQEILCMLRPVLPQTSVRWVAAYVAASDAQRKHGEQVRPSSGCWGGTCSLLCWGVCLL